MHNLLKVSVFVLLQYVFTARIVKGDTCELPRAMLGKCQCQSQIVICEDLNEIVPAIRFSNFYRLEVYNSNLTIKSNSFKNWTFTEVVLQNCSLTDSSLTAYSFYGLEHNIKKLSLADNELTKLPISLSKFTGIKELDVSGNPIDENSFNEDILRDIGDTLLGFSFGTKIGSTELKQWPTTLKHLQKLQELNLKAADVTFLPTRAFHGFEGTLLRLSISHTNLRSIPLAISNLRYLQALHFDHNTKVGDYGVRIPLVKGFLPYLMEMSLKDDNITTFPDVLQSFDRLDQLNMDENNLKFVSDKSAKAVAQISSLSLKKSGITRVPGAIQDVTYLNVLDLSNNSIHAIETNDFKESAELLTLRLNNNPILYISEKAFESQTKLRRLELKNVQITRVPCALEGLLRHHTNSYIVFDLSENTIECNCGLRWLYDVKNDMRVQSRFRLIGNCDTISSTLQDYLDNQLSDCPRGIDCSDS